MTQNIRMSFSLLKYCFLITVSALILNDSVSAQGTRTFVHPGILHTQASLDYTYKMAALKKYPWYDTYLLFSTSPYSKQTYVMQGGDSIATRDASYNTPIRNQKTALESDAYAIYCQALMYKLLKKDVYAQNAAKILNDWSYKLKTIVGADQPLTVAFNAYFMVCGAELIRDYAGWGVADQNQAKKMFREIFYPKIKSIEVIGGQGTWDSSSAKCVMAMGIYLEDWNMFDSAYNYFYNGAGNGTINHYFIESGQSQESGRKQGYAQLGLGNFEEWGEIAYNQGKPELWNERNNIIAASFEYHAKYNVGEDVPFTTIYGKYDGTTFTSISSDGRGSFKPIYYMAYNNFHNRYGIEMPYTKRVITEKLPIETTHQTITDGAGYGSLFFNNPDQLTSGVSGTKSSEYSVFSIDGYLVLKGCANKKVDIYTTIGTLVDSETITDDMARIKLKRGIYVAKVSGSFAKKIVVD